MCLCVSGMVGCKLKKGGVYFPVSQCAFVGNKSNLPQKGRVPPPGITLCHPNHATSLHPSPPWTPPQEGTSTSIILIHFFSNNLFFQYIAYPFNASNYVLYITLLICLLNIVCFVETLSFNKQDVTNCLM